MQTIYYVQINLTAIIILLLVAGRARSHAEQLTSSRLLFSHIVWSSMFLCFADFLAGASSGAGFAGASTVVEIGNMLYYEVIVAIGYIWMLYVDCRLDESTEKKPLKKLLWAIPLILFTALLLSNPVTHCMFYVNGNNEYVRGKFIFIHWFISWFYVLVPTFKAWRAIKNEPNKIKKRELYPLLYFVIAPVLTSLAQIFLFGTSICQIGITISIIMVFLSVQGNQIQTDALTGLSNRQGFEYYLAEHVQHHVGAELSLLMIDVNHFKQINDKFGHMAGDLALKETAQCIKQACGDIKSRPFICRYGGDEFVVSCLCDSENADKLVSLISSSMKNAVVNAPYTLSASIGAATGKCSCVEDAQALLAVADMAMYKCKEKEKEKIKRTGM